MERPILFSAPMVRAILAGTKTQTRRVVATALHTAPVRWEQDGPIWQQLVPDDERYPETFGPPVRCPFGVPGDRLYVRETWSYYGGAEYLYQRDPRCVAYAADADTDPRLSGGYVPGGRWIPSIHMPRWASRIMLEVTDVRVERLQDISEDDARAEGFPMPGPVTTRLRVKELDGTVTTSIAQAHYFDAKMAFCHTWEALNGERAPWSSNPWVWVVGFKKVTP